MDTYKVEPAKSNRSSCKACKSKIEKDELRFGTGIDSFGDGLSYQWRCLTCITSKQAANVVAKVGSCENVSGYDLLAAAQKTMFRKAFEKAAGPAAKAKGKAKAKAVPKERAKAVAKVRVKVPSLKEQHSFLDCAKKFDFKRVRELIEANAGYVNVQPAGRWTALHQAAEKGDAGMVKFLLDKGARTDLKTKDGQTPHDVAKANVKAILVPKKRGAAGGEPAAKRAKPGELAPGVMKLYCDNANPLSSVGCEDLVDNSKDPEPLQLHTAPPSVRALALDLKKALDGATLPAGESDCTGEVIVVQDPVEDTREALLTALGVATEDPNKECNVWDAAHVDDADWGAKADSGFCYDSDSDSDEDEDEEGDRAKVKAATKILAEGLEDHFELKFSEDVCVAPVVYGGFKGGCIVGILSMRVWT